MNKSLKSIDRASIVARLFHPPTSDQQFTSCECCLRCTCAAMRTRLRIIYSPPLCPNEACRLPYRCETVLALKALFPERAAYFSRFDLESHYSMEALKDDSITAHRKTVSSVGLTCTDVPVCAFMKQTEADSLHKRKHNENARSSICYVAAACSWAAWKPSRHTSCPSLSLGRWRKNTADGLRLRGLMVAIWHTVCIYVLTGAHSSEAENEEEAAS
ncbi:unnamed protein product [Cylicostephanus goldi]|uniref:Uncharacterized protein n=1 Tax=Cylicostephanus goldi TaxID=71465 RepID=A0A3P7MPN1_CYLGO|nr:unnamed protein product [Cylicostephanus goldi]